MTRVTYSRRARQDLFEIGDRIAADNPQIALKFVAGLREHCNHLQRLPRLGRSRFDIRHDVRSFPHGRYIVYYRYVDQSDRVEIIRIFHGSRQQLASEILS